MSREIETSLKRKGYKNAKIITWKALLAKSNRPCMKYMMPKLDQATELLRSVMDRIKAC